MIRENWRTFGFWRWWWRSVVPTDAKYVVAVLLAGVLLVGGYFASGHLSGASAAADSYVRETTISKVVTVKEHGRTIVKRVPVVIRKTIVHSSTKWATSVDTRVVTAPGGLRYVTKKVVRYVPVVHKRTVLVNGKSKTITETRLVPTVKTQTLTNVVTNQQTVTNQSTVVVNKTNTVTQPVTTVETHTVTLPAQTVTETQTQTVTETQVVTTTVQEPGTTITITLPLGGG
ncbi:MAG TPA: hypothetical protein VLJ44_11790 [Gaiellaceae bacterium]|nr:hypothetical protein [Gaiellaceae bacterium]